MAHSWLEGLRAKILGAPPGVFLGAFGKHPGWNDHVEPIGLDSEQLLAAREILYVHGIGGIVDTAAWEKNPAEMLPRIGHVFSWNGETDTLIGRMWSSTDGKGRARYPMVALAHLEVPFSYSLAVRTAKVLASVEARCRQASAATDVRAIFATARDELRASLAQPPDGLGGEPNGAVCARLANAMWLNEGETFARVLRAIDGKLGALAPATRSAAGKISLKMLEPDAPAQQVRLPMEPGEAIDDIAFWQKVVVARTPPRLPLLYLHPVDQPWVDLIIGAPSPKQLYCLRANEAALPPAGAVPCELDAAYRKSAAEFLAKICGAPARSETPPPLPTQGP